MATWIWIVIAVGAAVLLALLVFGMVRGRQRRIVQRRQKAHELRQEAETRTGKAKERERFAEEQTQRAREERKEAEKVGARADRIDPDRD